MTPLSPQFFLLYGEDEPALKDYLSGFLDELGQTDFNVTRLGGKDTTASEIISDAASLPFLAETRIVLVSNMTEISGGADTISPMADLLPGLPDWARIVLFETNLYDQPHDSAGESKRKQARRRVLKKLIDVVENDVRGKVLPFKKPDNIVGWIRKRASQHNTEIEPAAAEMLAQRIGDDFVQADTELTKLSTYVNRERPIAAKDVDMLTPFTPEASIFKMVDAVGQRDGRTALNLLQRLLDDGDEPLRIFGMIIRQYRMLIEMREFLDNGGSANGAAQALGMRAFVARKLAGQAQQYRIDQLERVYHYLFKTDLEIKTGQIEGALALQMLITRLARRSG